MDTRIRLLEEHDLAEADRIMRLAFGTIVGLAEPMQMFGDSDLARTRFRADGAPRSPPSRVANSSVRTSQATGAVSDSSDRYL